uniref:Xylose isomerase-like TIM barrel domain-containing protein n=1 Tax=uncultured Latescibacterota bacterium TaxID=199737 RepID=Q2YZV1_9BACT|nr:hypothetical protein [uncultured Latescibacterota bacterium]
MLLWWKKARTLRSSMLSLSTCWRAGSGLSGTELVHLYRRLGFRFMEVEYRLSLAQIREIETCVHAGLIRVSSVHNYVPRIPGEGEDTDGGDRFLLSSIDEGKRTEAVEKTCRTLEWAVRLSAAAVVLHLGRVEARATQGPLLDLFRAGMADSEKAECTRRALVRGRVEASEPFLNQVLKSVREIEARASALNLRIGLENRYYYHQIPSPEELAVLLARTRPDVTGYWHDVGHGQVMENLGLRKHADHLKVAGDRLLGVHFHDLVGVDDHIAPGTGEFDFEVLRPWLRPHVLRVMELHPRVTDTEVIRGREYLESLGVT